MAEQRIIIFDFDGVIVESVDVKTEAFRKLFADHPAHQEAIVAYHQKNSGTSRMVKIRYIYEHMLRMPLTEENFNARCKRYSELVMQQVIEAPFVPGAFEFLRSFYQAFDFYVVSGTPQEELRLIVKARALDRFFKGVYGSPEVKTTWVKHILNQAQVKAKDAVFVGDALADYEAAQANGVHFIARVPKQGKDIFEGKIIDAKMENLKALESAVKALS